MPLCERCGPEADHYTKTCPKRFEKSAAPKTRKVNPIIDLHEEIVSDTVSAEVECVICGDRALKAHLAKKFDRKSYMREYMKDWREKQRSKK